MSTIRPEVTGRKHGETSVVDNSDAAPKKRPKLVLPTEVKQAFSIQEFCACHNISEAYYYELQKHGKGPRTMHVGRRRLISVEEAQRWREAKTAKESSVA
jgi:hypothetical protein